MPARTLTPPVHPPAIAGRPVRIEYLGFQNLESHRDFRLRVHLPDGPAEVHVRIPLAAFGDGRVRLQDGPDVCYQKLLRAAAAGEPLGPDAITIDDAELVGYREAHTPVPRTRSFTPSTTPKPTVPRDQVRTPYPQRPSPPPAAVAPPPLFEVGQRVRHAIFGVGVTTSSGGGHTVVCFDDFGKKTFITSILEVDILSAPHAWETSRRGVNQPVAPPVADAGANQALPADK
jgi:hypothetical protein